MNEKWDKVQYDSNARMMFICDKTEQTFENVPLTVCGETLNVGDYSHLHNFYKEPLRYCGKFDEDTYAFAMGNEKKEDLFENKTLFWYDLIIVLKTRDDQILNYIGRHIVQYLYNNKKDRWL